jgi:hypothetical protein
MLQAFAVLALAAVPLLVVGRHAGTEELHPFAAVLCAGVPALVAISVLVLPGLMGLRGQDRKRGPGSRPLGPVGEAQPPMSVNRWIDQVDTARPGPPKNDGG